MLLLGQNSPVRCQLRVDPDHQIKMDIAHCMVVSKSF